MKLSKRITLLFSLAILFSIFIVTLISNAMINNTFDEYLVGEQSDTVERISEEINDLYKENDYEFYAQQIDSYASLEGLDISIRNQQDEVVYSSNQPTNSHGMHGGMSRRHREMMNQHGMTQENYLEKSFDLLKDNRKVGTVTIGYIDNSIASESALLFKSTLSKILLIASILALVIGIITSILLSNSLTKPLIEIKDTSQEIQEGNLSKKAEPGTDIIEIQELADSINYLGQSLAEQEKIRQAYASDISHELRTPLSTLKSHVEAIMDGVWEPNQEHLSILMQEINRLAALIDDLKDSFHSSEEAPVLHKQSFNLSQALDEIATTFLPIVQQEGLQLSVESEQEIEVWMDPNRIKQVLYNLLTNAVNYTDPGGEIDLSLAKLSKQEVRIRVKDTGAGIPEEDIPYLFNRFYRIDSSRTKATGGTGLGLAIAQSIVKEHGGRIQVDSALGKGTSFTIDLPIE